MIKRIPVFLLFLLAHYSCAYSQESEKILYIFPDSVELRLNEYIKRQNKKEHITYLTLSKKDEGRYYLYVTFYAKQHAHNIIFWVKSTNRYAVVGQEKYPLLFDYDYDFSTKDILNIGEYGKRDGQILKTRSIHDGFHIEFDKNGIINDD